MSFSYIKLSKKTEIFTLLTADVLNKKNQTESTLLRSRLAFY